MRILRRSAMTAPTPKQWHDQLNRYFATHPDVLAQIGLPGCTTIVHEKKIYDSAEYAKLTRECHFDLMFLQAGRGYVHVEGHYGKRMDGVHIAKTLIPSLLESAVAAVLIADKTDPVVERILCELNRLDTACG